MDRHLKLVESGLLSLVFASFSSQDKGVRQVGYLALARIYEQLERAKLTMEKQVSKFKLIVENQRKCKSKNMLPVMKNYLKKD